MSKAPTHNRFATATSSPEGTTTSTSNASSSSKQNRRVTIAAGCPSSYYSSSSKPSGSNELTGTTSAKRILRKNMSMSSSEDAVPVEQTRARSGSSGRVHFPASQVTPEHAGEILVNLSPDQMHADAHLGFLQEGRRYEINISVPKFLGENATVARPNAHLQLKEIRTTAGKSGHELVLELEAYHDKLVNEEIAISTDKGDFELSVSARVLGRGKGTPMLKRGIRCIAIDQGDSEMSDAPGGGGTSSTSHHHHHHHHHRQGGDGDHDHKPAGATAARRPSGGGGGGSSKHDQ